MRYDLNKFDIIFSDILRKGKPTSYDLNLIKNELNKFYQGDNQCKEVIFTNNTDRAFFGMCVYPNINTEVMRVFALEKEDPNNTNKKSYSYVLEFDSKLLDELNGFEPRELTAILMHEIGHIVQNEGVNNEIIKDCVVEYQTKNRTNIDIGDFGKCFELFKYAYIHTIQNIQSIFNKNQEEFEADRFSIETGYGPDLESAFTKIIRAKGSIKPQGKLNALIWTLTVHKNIIQRKKFICKCMDDINNYSGSKLEKEANSKLKDSLIKAFKQPINESFICEDRMEYITELFNGIKRSGLKAIEDDTYVYNVRIKNVDNEIEAMDIMRDLNSKINIVSDYLSLQKDISDSDFKRWTLLLQKLQELRDNLSKSDSYKPKYYGLFVQLPVVKRQY